MTKILTVVGARPQFIKAAPVSRQIRVSGKLNEVLVHTGQHFDDNMSRVFFDQLEMPQPDHNLGISGGTHGQMTGKMLDAVECVLREERPALVLVYGDTNSTLAGALAAAKLQIPLVHVEAGLRSFNRSMPEEVNRIVADSVAQILLCPTRTAVDQLKAEGHKRILDGGKLWEPTNVPFPDGRPGALHESIVVNVGDVMYDAITLFGERANEKSEILERIGLCGKEYVLVTLHREENTANAAILDYLVSQLCELARYIRVVFPLHPRTRQLLASDGKLDRLQQAAGLVVTEPQPYLDFVRLEQSARVIVTDSGGVQKEAFFFGIPCVTLRDETEWVETVACGWNVLAGRLPGDLVGTVLRSKPSRSGEACFGDGNAASRIVEAISGWLKRR